MYHQGYQDGNAGEPMDDEYSADADYIGGFEVGTADRAESMDPNFVRRTAIGGNLEEFEVNRLAAEYVDGFEDGLKGDEFQFSIRFGEAYRAGFSDGATPIGGAS